MRISQRGLEPMVVFPCGKSRSRPSALKRSCGRRGSWSCRGAGAVCRSSSNIAFRLKNAESASSEAQAARTAADSRSSGYKHVACAARAVNESPCCHGRISSLLRIIRKIRLAVSQRLCRLPIGARVARPENRGNKVSCSAPGRDFAQVLAGDRHVSRKGRFTGYFLLTATDGFEKFSGWGVASDQLARTCVL
jgi:hypothetical protein